MSVCAQLVVHNSLEGVVELRVLLVLPGQFLKHGQRGRKEGDDGYD